MSVQRALRTPLTTSLPARGPVGDVEISLALMDQSALKRWGKQVDMQRS
jgi:hypothetical protein